MPPEEVGYWAEHPRQLVVGDVHSLWVRREVGAGEVVDLMGLTMVEPVNIVGMPVIGQRVMVMDPTPMANLDLMQTHLLPAGDAAIPHNNIRLKVRMEAFAGTAPAGEVLPSEAANPLVQNIGASCVDGGGVRHSISGQEWLFDTGAGSTMSVQPRFATAN